MFYNLVTFNEYRKLILHSDIKYYIIMMTTMLIIVSFQFSLSGENFLESIFSATLHQFGGVPPT